MNNDMASEPNEIEAATLALQEGLEKAKQLVRDAGQTLKELPDASALLGGSADPAQAEA